MTTDLEYYYREVMSGGIPARPDSSVVAWAEKHVYLPGSARSPRFQCDLTPWLRVPIECTDDGHTRTMTLVKPVQSGGSVVGEIAIDRWTSCWTNGDIQYNWEDDIKAGERWKKRIEPILKACPTVAERWPSKAIGERSKAVIGMVNFPHLNLICQGVFNPANLDSDSIRGQVNEEVHNWPPGMMGKADRRQTAYWNSIQVNISNAGTVGDQLHRKFIQGTQEYFEAWCPGCKGFHFMRTKWEDDKPTLGGLRYDADGCRLANGDYDYPKMLSTIRFQMPCGFEVRDTPNERRPVALKGKYGEPQNKGATMENRSFTYDGVVVDYIPFLTLIQEKHEALRFKRNGDIEPFKRYVQERECRFWDVEESMDFARIEVTTGILKSREGMVDRDARCMVVDRQRGKYTQGENAHYVVEIDDWKEGGRNQLVYEGKVNTEAELEALRVLYEVPAGCVLIDSGWDTQHVYELCLKYGYKALKGGTAEYYIVENKRTGRKFRRIFQKSDTPQEVRVKRGGEVLRFTLPLYFYSKNGILDRLQWLENQPGLCVIPEDVSEDWKFQNQNMHKIQKGKTPDGLPKLDWQKIDEKRPNDFKMCRGYSVLFAEMMGFIGVDLTEGKTDDKTT